MTEKAHAKEVLVFAVEALMRHEDEIDRLIGELSKLKENQAAEQNQLDGRLKQIGKKTAKLKATINTLKERAEEKPEKWKEFQESASQAESLTFGYDEKAQTFQVEAHKQGRSVCYSGKVPSLDVLMRTWLEKTLETPIAEDSIAVDGPPRDDALPSESVVTLSCEARSKEAL